MNRVAQSVPAASCGSVPLPTRTPGGTPGELAGGEARGTDMGEGGRHRHRLWLLVGGRGENESTENCCKPRQQPSSADFAGLLSRFAAIRSNPHQIADFAKPLFQPSPMSMLSTLTYVYAPCLLACEFARRPADCSCGQRDAATTRSRDGLRYPFFK